MTATFAPPRGPSLGISSDVSTPSTILQSDSGAEQARLRNVRMLRSYQLTWEAASEDVRDYVYDFFARMGGADEAFFWTPPEKVPSPLAAGPTVSSYASTTIAQQTYDLAYTWFDGSGETKPSPITTFLRPANHKLIVTVPAWPQTGISGWRVYDSRVPHNRIAEVTSGTTWTQTSDLSTGTAAPTANTLVVASKWRRASDLQITPLGSCKFRVSVSFREVSQ